MARNRVIYQSEALFVSKNAGSTAALDHKQIERVQSANFSYTINRQDINQFGQLARIDSVILDPPTVSTDFSYYLTDGFNERALGFYVQTGGGNRNAEVQFASGHMIGTSGKNLFIVTGPEGKDLNLSSLTATDNAIGIGNAYLTDYTVDLAVGSIPTVSVSMEAANVRSDDSANSISSPAVNEADGTSIDSNCTLPTPSSGVSSIKALRPGDITVNLTNFDSDTIVDLDGAAGTAHVQSASISVPLSRSPIQRLGTRFPFAREVDYPINVTMSVSAILNDQDAYNLSEKLTAGVQSATITLKQKGSDDTDGDNAMLFTLKGAKVDSESMSSAIGSNKTVDLTLSAQIGGVTDTTAGLFVSGANTTSAFELRNID